MTDTTRRTCPECGARYVPDGTGCPDCTFTDGATERPLSRPRDLSTIPDGTPLFMVRTKGHDSTTYKATWTSEGIVLPDYDDPYPPSMAARMVVDGPEVNGWRAWLLDAPVDDHPAGTSIDVVTASIHEVTAPGDVTDDGIAHTTTVVGPDCDHCLDEREVHDTSTPGDDLVPCPACAVSDENTPTFTRSTYGSSVVDYGMPDDGGTYPDDGPAVGAASIGVTVILDGITPADEGTRRATVNLWVTMVDHSERDSRGRSGVTVHHSATVKGTVTTRTIATVGQALAGQVGMAIRFHPEPIPTHVRHAWTTHGEAACVAAVQDGWTRATLG